jgi:inhibitor of KinA sporulation pathway (predicted exonuclease)
MRIYTYGGVKKQTQSRLSSNIVTGDFRDQSQQNVYELRRLEKQVEMLEEWGIPRQQNVR